MNSNAIILFVKNPEPGKVKTRLAKDIGDELAFHIYLKLVRHTREIVLSCDADRLVFYSNFIPSSDHFEEPDFHRMLQHGSDLGARMRNAFEQVFADGYRKVVIIGSDCPDLTEEHISMTFQLLDEFDAVIGPASDGGYYLLGLKSVNSRIFSEKAWSSHTVLENTIADFRELDWKYVKIDVLGDIDTLDDLKNLRPDWVPQRTGDKRRDD